MYVCMYVCMYIYICIYIYINHLSNPKLFVDGTSLFSVIHDKDLSAKNLNDDLNEINIWDFQWKMSFNPIRLHLDYGDFIYGQTYCAGFHQKLESVQYNAALANAGAIRGTSKEELYNELGLECLVKTRFYRNCVVFLRFSDTNVQTVYSILFLLQWVHTALEILIIFLYSN